MAEEKVEVRDVNFRQVLPWTELFRGFQVALDPKKLVLAAAGIVVTSLGWWLLSWAFDPGTKTPPELDRERLDAIIKDVQTKYESTPEKIPAETLAAERRFKAEHKRDEKQWELLKETAGYLPLDDKPGSPLKPGTIRVLPWDENRGPNPYLLVTGESRQPWELKRQVLVMVEPLIKFLRPIKYLLNPNAGFKGHVYFLLVLVWTVTVWALFGGAITRMAAVQLTRKEKIGLTEAVRFAWSRYASFFSAPLFPLLFLFFILLLMVVFGVLHLIPILGDVVVDGIGWFLPLLGAVVMAVILVGLIGWPLMFATISVEGSDSFDALSRSYSYVYQCPWHYLWNAVVAIVYGALLVFFVGFMGSLVVYLSKWGVAQTPLSTYFNREPSYLFIYAPESFGWRDLLLEGSAYVDPALKDGALDELRWWNKLGAGLVSIWIYLAFLLIVGFGYSYFWCSSTIIYLLMRRQVDDTDLDEIYLEEDESEDAFSATVPAPAAAGAAAPAPVPSFQMVESPTLRPSAPAAPPPSATSTPVTSPATPGAEHASGQPDSAVNPPEEDGIPPAQ